jgi:hypothetical protein
MVVEPDMRAPEVRDAMYLKRSQHAYPLSCKLKGKGEPRGARGKPDGFSRGVESDARSA